MLDSSTNSHSDYACRSTAAATVQRERVDTVKNKLLRLIPQRERSQLLSLAERVRIQPRQVLHHWKLPMEYVYFIEHGLVSVAAKVERDRFVEVWLIGSEGMVGAPIILADQVEPMHRRIVQVGGSAWRLGVCEFRAALKELPQLRAALCRYLGVVIMQTSQSGACNSTHQVKHRLARWLLLAQSALDDREIPLTHDVLSQLLGVRRASVTETLDQLQGEGRITTKRGAIVVSDVASLEKACCLCFRLISREYDRQLSCQPVPTAIEEQLCNPLPA